MLTAAVKTLSNATEEAVAQIARVGDVQMQPTLLGNRSVIQITMMDPDIARIRDGWNGSFEGMPPEISDCSVREEYHRYNIFKKLRSFTKVWTVYTVLQIILLNCRFFGSTEGPTFQTFNQSKYTVQPGNAPL
jgi:hypothetical protein